MGIALCPATIRNGIAYFLAAALAAGCGVNDDDDDDDADAGPVVPGVIWNDPVDPRADVYSLGVILYELTTGKRLFDGDDPIKRIAAGDIPKPSSVRNGYPRGLEAVIQRAVASKPDDRFQTAGDLKLALETLATEHKWSLSDFRVAGFLADIFTDNDTPDAPEKRKTSSAGKTRIWVNRRRRAG